MTLRARVRIGELLDSSPADGRGLSESVRRAWPCSFSFSSAYYSKPTLRSVAYLLWDHPDTGAVMDPTVQGVAPSAFHCGRTGLRLVRVGERNDFGLTDPGVRTMMPDRILCGGLR